MVSERPLVATLVLALLVAGVAPLAGVAAAQQGDDGATITVSATGTAEAEPDVAVVNVAVTARGDSAEAVRESIASNASQLRTALTDANVSEDQLRTTGFSITREVRTDDDGTERFVGFRGVQSFEITLDNTSRAGEVVDLAVGNGANRVDGVTFTLSEERQRDLRAEALREAMANARSDAGAVASAGNVSITGISAVSTTDYGFSPLTAEAEAADARTTSTPTEIDAGPVTVTADVTVTYNATSS